MGTPFYDIKICVKPGGQLRKIVCSGTLLRTSPCPSIPSRPSRTTEASRHLI